MSVAVIAGNGDGFPVAYLFPTKSHLIGANTCSCHIQSLADAHRSGGKPIMGGGSAHMYVTISVSFSIHPSRTNPSSPLPASRKYYPRASSPRESPSGGDVLPSPTATALFALSNGKSKSTRSKMFRRVTPKNPKTRRYMTAYYPCSVIKKQYTNTVVHVGVEEYTHTSNNPIVPTYKVKLSLKRFLASTLQNGDSIPTVRNLRAGYQDDFRTVQVYRMRRKYHATSASHQHLTLDLISTPKAPARHTIAPKRVIARKFTRRCGGRDV